TPEPFLPRHAGQFPGVTGGEPGGCARAGAPSTAAASIAVRAAMLATRIAAIGRSGVNLEFIFFGPLRGSDGVSPGGGYAGWTRGAGCRPGAGPLAIIART